MAFQFLPFLYQLIVGIGLQILGFLLQSIFARKEQPAEFKDQEDPTAEAGRPIPVLFGEMEITGVNIIWFGDKRTVLTQVQ